ncbi:MAG: MATE family efflux transporter, partial [Rhizobium sp.]|uniref:MATE family efflux transporter n=1 Tax=Rhizobium sp. TaxID=391 RepID=UPI00389AE77C
AMISALGCGLALLGLSPLLMAAGLRLMGAEGAIAEATSTYFSIRMLAAPAALANYAILGFVLGRGQGNIGLLLQAVINGINILLSIYLGLTLDWGVAGVAWGTMAGETVGALAGLAIVLRGFGKAARPAWAEIFSRHRLAELFALNRDILIRTFLLIGAFTIMTRIGTSFGAVTLAANAVVMNFFLLSGYYLDGLANAAEQIIGRAIGAHYRPAFDRGLKLTILWSFGLAAVGSAFFFLAGPWLISVLTTSPEVRQAAEIYLPWAAVTGLTGALAFLMDGVFIGATWSVDMRNRMLISFAGYLVMLAVFVPLFGNHGLWLAMNAFLLFRGFFLATLVKRRADQTFRAAQ